MAGLNVYTASAGSGKTYQLVLTYISLLLGQMRNGRLVLFKDADRRRHREILAVTFTNKATQEMSSRIVKELALLANPQLRSDYRKPLHLLVSPEDKDCLNNDIDRDICLAATRALNSMLFDFGELQVSTIDAFFQRVLRSFAYEADLAGNYDLMLENDRMTDAAITNLLALACGMQGVVKPKALNVRALRDRVGKLINDRISKGKEYKLFSPDTSLRKELIRFIGQLSDESFLAKKESINEFLSLPEAISNLESALRSKRSELIGNLAAEVNALENCEASQALGANARKMLMKISSGSLELLTPGNRDLLLPGANLLKLLNKNKFGDSELNEFESAIHRVLSTLRMVFSIDTVLANMPFLSLFREITSVEQALKAHLNTIMLSDTNELLNKIIGDCDTPFIYERIGQKIHHFLIDEFQDTSKMQWENFRPLLVESLSHDAGYESLIIGDVKQCIYRFRNSNPELLARELAVTPGVGRYIRQHTLGSNWRSAPVVVDFNNRVFEAAGTRINVDAPKADAYADVAQSPQRSEIPGYVNVALAPKDEPQTGFTRMIHHINRELESGYSQSDIVILVRTRTDATRVVEELMQAVRNGELAPNTMVVSDEALYVSSSRAVQWIISRLQEMNALESDEPKINSRGLPKVSQLDIDRLQEHLIELNKDATIENPLERAIEDFNRLRAQSSLRNTNTHDRQKRASGQSLYEIVEELIRNLPDEAMIETEAQFLSAFQDLILDYSRTNAPTLQGFLKLWNDELSGKAAVGLADGVDAIRVMTIHKSKGLEFKCVHIPILQKRIDDEKNYRWYEVGNFLTELNLDCRVPEFIPLRPGKSETGASMEHTCFAGELKRLKDDQSIDELNVLYVAFTRAVQELIVTFNSPFDSAKNSVADIPVNHPAGLICPVLSTLRPPEDNTWEFGEPTRKFVSRSKSESYNQTTGLDIERYVTRRRKDMWSQTSAAKVSDSGEPI